MKNNPSQKKENLEELAARAREGDRQALEDLVAAIQGRVYGLSLRMLGYPQDAEDASQEILIKVVTRLSGFRGEAAFTTWVFKVAANHLLSTRKRRAETQGMTMELFEEMVEPGQDSAPFDCLPEGEKRLILEEQRASCMQGMLQCLNRKDRLALVLGEVFEVSGEEGAAILGVSHEAYRRRLSRSREKMRGFLGRTCGLVDASNPCQCERQTVADANNGYVSWQKPQFAGRPRNAPLDADVEQSLAELSAVARTTAMMRNFADYAPPQSFVQIIRELQKTKQYNILNT